MLIDAQCHVDFIGCSFFLPCSLSLPNALNNTSGQWTNNQKSSRLREEVKLNQNPVQGQGEGKTQREVMALHRMPESKWDEEAVLVCLRDE